MSEKYTVDNIKAVSAGEHIRLRPRLYFEKCFTENSLDILPFEVLCHAFDEYLDGNCNEIKITVHKDSFLVSYNVGMSLESKHDDLTSAEIIMTRISACSNQKKHLEVGEEFCHLGMATINLAAEQCQLTTIWNQKKGVYTFENGETKSKHIESVEEENNGTGIFVKPNPAIFENLTFTLKGIKEKAAKINEKLTDLKIEIEDKIDVANHESTNY